MGLILTVCIASLLVLTAKLVQPRPKMQPIRVKIRQKS